MKRLWLVMAIMLMCLNYSSRAFADDPPPLNAVFYDYQVSYNAHSDARITKWTSTAAIAQWEIAPLTERFDGDFPQETNQLLEDWRSQANNWINNNTVFQLFDNNLSPLNDFNSNSVGPASPLTTTGWTKSYDVDGNCQWRQWTVYLSSAIGFDGDAAGDAGLSHLFNQKVFYLTLQSPGYYTVKSGSSPTTSLTISPPSATIITGESYKFKSLYQEGSADPTDVSNSADWSRSALPVVDGFVTSNVSGDFHISATYNNLSADACLHVLNPPTTYPDYAITGLQLQDGQPIINSGDTYNIQVNFDQLDSSFPNAEKVTITAESPAGGSFLQEVNIQYGQGGGILTIPRISPNSSSDTVTVKINGGLTGNHAIDEDNRYSNNEKTINVPIGHPTHQF